ncbi:A/G-specific DNA-adenine glycosylase [Micromonospora pallida]|uniref:Adenine DNA glycosylase n=1 Tax=Micromonospora pallida TaxID=145854 RepID=A0A1C6TE77_9ACTN|nr:A/G-specific adenine glycosylase [Micromonospora pallida]SCL40088.1 A/G-specific DNA-adenine glycosylase [Micromonospora pallida]
MTEQSFADRVSRWYEQNARDLPWRGPDVSPWAILVSEVMLQQTPVVRVLPAWEAWLARWPVPAALAAESPADAIRMWGRLGYPRRAVRLHECAVALVERHGGAVPDRLDQLLALPGVGTYTGRAVAAFAFGQRHPVVDTNVRRVVARAVAGEPDAGPTTRPADLVATEELLPVEPAAAALASAAFMELGAVVCTARSPRCAVCPVASVCAWRASGQEAPTGPTRRPQRYAGTDRQVRGLLLAVLREAIGPVPRVRLDQVWSDDVQRSRALAALVTDGLVEPAGEATYRLAGDTPAPVGQNLA